MAADGDSKVALPLLFHSVLQVLQTSNGTYGVAAGVCLPADESVRRELQEWSRSCSLRRDDKDRYAHFYRRLVSALRQEQQQQQLRFFSTGVGNETIAQWVEADWPHDKEVLLRGDLSSTEAFIASLNTIASAWVDQVDNSHDGSAPPSVLSVVQKLCGMCSDGESGDHVTTAAVAEKKSMTMAEKLAHMRSQRSALIAKEASTRSVFPSTTAVPVLEADTTSSLAIAISSASTDSLRGDHDDSSLYFTIETRLELKERLTALQLRLDDLLLQAKLAWMKCFAHPAVHDGDGDQLSTDDGDEAVAAQLVTQGEALAFDLLDAFEMARKATCPIGDYKALVATCEAEFNAFQSLVNATAAAPSPVRSKPLQHECSRAPTLATDECERTMPIMKPRPAAFDLPSMKSYYDRAAPSYAAYLPKQKR